MLEVVTAPPSLPSVELNDQDSAIVASCWNCLMDKNDEVRPQLLRRGEQLVRVVNEDSGAPRLAAYTAPELRYRLGQVANFWRTGTRASSPARVPREVIDMLLRCHLEFGRPAPRISRVTSAPVFDSRGELIATPGYHPESELFYAPDPELAQVDWSPYTLPDEVTLEWAVDLLGDLIADFPFAEQADRANALALLLLPFIRELVTGPTPVHTILAPAAGSGKTLLAQVLLYPACGPTAVYAEPRAEEEWRKALTTYLLTSPTAIIFDNVSRLDSAALAAAITSPTCTWTDRVLGASEQASMQVRCAWVVTGNNVTLTTEQARRAAPIRLDSELEQPWQRTTFRHPSLITYAAGERVALVGAALAIISHYLRAPSGGGLRVGSLVLGSFESWARRLGGILEEAGIQGFMENHASFAQVEDVEDEGLAEFLEAWHQLNQGPQRSRELESLVSPLGPLHEVAPVELRSVRDNERSRALQTWLRVHKGRVAGGYRLKLACEHRARRTWEVVKL